MKHFKCSALLNRKQLFLISLMLFTFSQSFAGNKLFVIENSFIKVGLLPDVGGRMVFFAPAGEENFLLSDSTYWNEPDEKRIKPSPTAPFKPYFGLTTWVGPQSEWWVHQDLNPGKKQRADVWPPDPYLIYSNFEIIEKTDTSVVMGCDCSPISGVKLIKKFVLDKNELHIEHAAINCHDSIIAWDLWSNARFDAFTEFKVPVNDESIQKIQATEDMRNEIISHKIENGYFTFMPELPIELRKQRVSKAFIYPSEGKMIVNKNGHALSIHFDMVPKEQIHPEQALVEVYNCVTTNGRDNVLELEHHSAYQKIAPGNNISLNEVWKLNKNQKID
jgi:hypothetical protein